MAYKGQSNAFSTGEIAYTGQLNAITSGEIPSVGLFSSQIPKVALLKGAKTINLTKSKPQEVKIHLNLTNESINLILPKNMTNSTSKAA